jgi:hypothetical protein
MRRLATRENGPTRKSLALSHTDACNPLLQAHPTWAQDNTKAASFPLLCLSPFPPSCSVSHRPIWAGTRGDNLLVGPGTPQGRNADNLAKRLPLCRVSASLHSAKGPPAGPFVSFFINCARRHSAKLASLPSARVTTLGKEDLPVPRCSFSAECYGPDTRQRGSLSSVTLGKVTSIYIFYLFFSIPSKQTKDITYTSQISHNHHRYHIYITYLTNTINQTSSHSITNMFGHKHKYPTLKNISLKYLTKSYQHLTSSDRVISQSMNNNKKDNISSMWAAGLVRRWLGNP